MSTIYIYIYILKTSAFSLHFGGSIVLYAAQKRRVPQININLLFQSVLTEKTTNSKEC